MILATLIMLLCTIQTKVNTGTHKAGDVIAASKDVNKNESKFGSAVHFRWIHFRLATE